MNQAYEQWTAVLDPDKVSGWELDALRAEADRGEALDIYLLKGDKAKKSKISEKRQRLSAKIEKFHSNGQAFFKGLEIDGAFTPQDDPAFCGKEEEKRRRIGSSGVKGTGKFLERNLRSWLLSS
ncbi:hypothetical protein EDD17DRAFT_1762603 [Pisolithus thermaeus]|nr:hypothetical protein EDD17DRAFT_1762603 [Pisolithus thermaeus]